MTTRLVRAESGDFAGLLDDMLSANAARADHEALARNKSAARTTTMEQSRLIMRAQRLDSSAQYGRSAKALAQKAPVDSLTVVVHDKLRALHSVPQSPVVAILRSKLPAKLLTEPESVLKALLAMEKDSAPGPDRTGVMWILLAAIKELGLNPDHSGLQLLTLVIKKITTGEFSAHVRHILSAALLILPDKGVERICHSRSVLCYAASQRCNFYRVATQSIMQATAAKAKEYLFLPLVGCGVKCGVGVAVNDAKAFIREHSDYPTFILASADAENAFNKTSHQ